MNTNIFVEMIRLAEQIGDVAVANMYDAELLAVEGKTKDRKKFSLSLHIKEEEKDA